MPNNQNRDDKNKGREPQSSGPGAKNNEVKIGSADETADRAQENSGEERKGREPIKTPGGQSRVADRSDDRNDGKPDEPMPPLDGSRK